MRELSEIYLHVGLPKTGTTFLQENVFPHFDELHLVRGYRPFRSLFEGAARRSILLSDESLSGDPFGPRSGPGHWAAAFSERMEILASLFPNAHVIVGFRRHADLIVSLYKQHLHQGGTRTLEQFWSGGDSDDALLSPRDLGYADRLDEVRARFSGRLFVYTQEELQQDPMYLVGELARFFGASLERARGAATAAGVSWTGHRARRNSGVRGWAATLLRRLNQIDGAIRRLPGSPTLRPRVLRKLRLDPRGICQTWLRPLSRGELTLSGSAREEVERLFAEDWQRVLDRIEATRRTAREPDRSPVPTA